MARSVSAPSRRCPQPQRHRHAPAGRGRLCRRRQLRCRSRTWAGRPDRTHHTERSMRPRMATNGRGSSAMSVAAWSPRYHSMSRSAASSSIAPPVDQVARDHSFRTPELAGRRPGDEDNGIPLGRDHVLDLHARDGSRWSRRDRDVVDVARELVGEPRADTKPRHAPIVPSHLGLRRHDTRCLRAHSGSRMGGAPGRPSVSTRRPDEPGQPA